MIMSVKWVKLLNGELGRGFFGTGSMLEMPKGMAGCGSISEGLDISELKIEV